jgi:hypothetical protein
MSNYYILKTALTLHIVGLAASSGLSLALFLATSKFWKILSQDRYKAAVILTSMKYLPVFVWIGIGLSILSGAVMMNIAYSAFMFQLWFQVKLVAVLVIILSGIIGGLAMHRVRKLIATEGDLTVAEDVLHRRAIIEISGAVQLLVFIVIFIMAAFRFV